MRTVHCVLPNDIDDPARPSGGNIYDRRLIRGLTALGWTVIEHAVVGDWPDPGTAARQELAARLAALPSGAVVLLDGLVASAVPEILAREADRLRLVILVHMPVGDAGGPVARAREAEALQTAVAVMTVSRWSRDRLVELGRQVVPVRRHLDGHEIRMGGVGLLRHARYCSAPPERADLRLPRARGAHHTPSDTT